MAVARIQVIATNGKAQKQIVWLTVRKNGIYCDIANPGLDRHFSIHSSGWSYASYEGKSERLYKLEPFDKFKGRHQLATFSFVPDISKLETAEYTMKKLDAVIFVDTRIYMKKQYILCNIDLIEPKNYDMLYGMDRFGGELHIYTQFVPWIVISIH